MMIACQGPPRTLPVPDAMDIPDAPMPDAVSMPDASIPDAAGPDAGPIACVASNPMPGGALACFPVFNVEPTDQYCYRHADGGACYYYGPEGYNFFCAPKGDRPAGTPCEVPNNCAPNTTCHECVCREICRPLVAGEPEGPSTCSSGACYYVFNIYMGVCI